MDFLGAISLYATGVAVFALVMSTVDSLFTDTSIRRTPRVGPCLSLLPLFDSL